MTLNGAIMELVMLSEHPMMPAVFKPSIQKIIETISEWEEPERKTGRWNSIQIGEWHGVECTACHIAHDAREVPHKTAGGIAWKFCPECGAKMEVSNEAD